MSNETQLDALGRVETVTIISPKNVVKGVLPGDLVLHQVGGMMPDGRFTKLDGRPVYTIGDDVVVFAIARLEGDYQTAEMLLGKFEVLKDQANRLFAVPDLERGVYDGVVIYRGEQDPSVNGSRDLNQFLAFLSSGATSVEAPRVQPNGSLTRVNASSGLRAKPNWGFLNDTLYRWNNGATAAWTKDGAANMTGGGAAELTGALATWTNEPNSTINYTDGSNTSNFVHLNATSSPCGWTTCFPGSGVIGCGGPSGGGTHTFRGDTYNTTSGGEVWLRCYSSFNQVSSIVTQAVLTHELGHTLGLGHSDQNTSVHDTCGAADNSSAIMNSTVPARTTLGTDDVDAVRWVYGDGGNHCTGGPTVTSISPTSGTGPVVVTINGTNFQNGATVTFAGGAATNVIVNSATQITATNPPLGAGTLDDVAVISAGTGTLARAFFANFFDVPAGNAFQPFVEKIFRHSITSGCGSGNYCPQNAVTRDQMAVFIEKAMRGDTYSPPAATGTVFTDVPVGAFAAPFIEQLARDGVTGGCGGGAYCPQSPVTRAQMAVFLLRGKHGSAYNPPPATGTRFADVPANAFAAAWIEELAAEGITSGCDATHYCPDNTTTRAQMAVFLTVAFSLP